MKQTTCLLLLLLVLRTGFAQKGTASQGQPITISIFTESVSLPNLRFNLRKPNLGMRIGTELYYRRKEGHQLLQTVGLGYYRHKGLQSGFFINTEFGYRKFIGHSFADITIGGGYLLQHVELPLYRPMGNDQYRMASPIRHLFMPVAGIGAGHRLRNGLDLFGRYEVFGEMPFQLLGIPILPHKALHLGTRFNLH